MSEAAAEAEAAEAARQPRFGVYRGAMLAFVGSAAIAALLAQLVVWVFTGMSLLAVALAGFGYALALLVWAGLWKRPWHVAAVIAAALAGLFCGYVLSILLGALLDTRPEA